MSSETLTQSDFDARRADGKLSLTFIGMSNAGKSHWSGRLAREANFDRVDIDTLIELELETELKRAGYSGGIQDVAKWMGQPYEPQSPANQQTYLDLEAAMMERTIDELADPSLDRNTVVDTTGSIVHTDPAIGARLREHSTVVYLEATANMRQKMFEMYIAEPKPVIWGDVYTQVEGEATDQALARSYPELLERRSYLYEKMAHVAVSREVSLAITSTDEFLEYIRDKLPTAYVSSASYPSSQV